jgi:gliding motility-associated-like protein
MKKIYSTLFLAITASCLFGQIAVTQTSNSQTLSQLLAGSGVTISNYSMRCATNGSGTFTNTNTNLGMPGGVVLASGRVTNVPNAANVFASTQFTLTGEPQLSTLTAGTIYDPCVLEFDVVPQGPLLKFDYVFASEEYPEWVCSQFNDVFGFFISGPIPGGGTYTNKNMALIPGTNLPVAINTVNPGTPGTSSNGGHCTGTNQTLNYSSLYINNQSPINPRIVYDGMTHLLTATAAVTPCQVYHLKIAIADVADRIFDSGVFLSAYSFNSNPVSISAVGNLDYAGFSSAYEGCVGGTFTLTLSQVQTVDMYVDVVVSGTATNGVDYTAIPATILIPAGQTSVNIDLNPIADGLTENMESVTIATLNPCTGTVSASATINIRDDIAPTISVADSTLCLGQSTQLDASGGITYSWTPTTGLSNPNIKNPIATPTATTTYTCNMTFGACIKTLSKTIYVSNPANTITANPAGTICNGGTVQLTSAPTNGASPYNYLWSNGGTTPVITAAAGGTYTVTATDAYGCSASATRTVAISNLSIAGTTTNVSCVGATNGAIDITVTGINAPYTYDWGGGVVSQDRNNLLAGTYAVTASNTIGCSVTASFTITQPSSNLTSTVTSTPVTCNGGNNGSINLSPTGGVTPYTFAWSNSATAEDINNLTANSYTVTITDLNGCTTSRTVNITQPAALVVSFTSTNPVCNGATTGSINATITGGTSPYTYVWNDGSTLLNRTTLNAGLYTITATDNKGCTVSSSRTITQPSAITITPTVTNASCAAGNDGSINLNISGGAGGYTYNWGGGVTTQNRSGLIAGTYTVTVSDASGCTASLPIAVTQIGTGIALTSTVTNVSCNAGSNGAIDITVVGGTLPINYNWSGSITTQDRASLPAGNYSVTVTDGAGCSAIASNNVTQPATLTATKISTNVLCNGANTGSITLTVTGGITPYSYNWGSGITSQNRTGIAAGNYTVTVNDANLCSTTLSTIITQPVAALTALVTNTPVSCFGGNNGAVSLLSAGGTTPYTYNWSNGSFTQNLNNVVAGNYMVTVTDAHNCSVSATSLIAQPVAPVTTTLTASNVLCNGTNTGSIINNTIGGTPPYIFVWNDASIFQNRTALAPGTYTVTVTDVTPCSATKSITITQPAALIVTNNNTNITCNGGNNGSINLTVTGGTPGYTYNWGSGITAPNRTGLTGGTYTVTVTDANACSRVNSITMYQPNPISMTAIVTNPSCNGLATGDISLSVTGGTGAYTYNWGGGITTANRTSLIAGTYSVTVTDASGCTGTASVTITQPSILTTTLTANAVDCMGGNNGSISTVTTGGTSPFTYTWNDGNTNENRYSLTAGTYTVTVSDLNNCTATATVAVTQPSTAVTVAVTNTSNINCYGDSTGTINTTAGGGVPAYTYTWSDGSILQNRTTMQAGNYQVSVSDSHGCVATTAAVINQPASALNIDTLLATNIACYGLNNGAINTTVSGGISPYTYNWGGGITTANRNNLAAGSYTLSVTDSKGCITSANATVTQPASAVNATLAATNITCFGGNTGAIDLTATGGVTPYTFNWGSGIITEDRTNLAAGTYSVIVTDSNNCTVSKTATITQATTLTATVSSSANVSCSGGNNGTINIAVSGGNPAYNYNWGNGITTPNRTGLTYGTYSVTVTDASSCSASASATITQPASALAVAVSSATNVSCFGGNNGAINISATGGTTTYNYNWGSGITTQNRTGLASGSYNVTVTDANSCSASASATITQPASALSVSVLSATNIACFGASNGAITISAAGGTTAYSYNWGSGITTQNRTGLAGGTYRVTVTDANSCSASASATITQPASALVVAVSSATNVSCFGGNNGAINISATGGTTAYSYNWGGGITTQNRTGLNEGSYTVTVTDANSCSASASATVTQPASALAATVSSATNVSCFGGNNGAINISATGGTTTYNYNWGSGITTQNRTGLASGTYRVTITDANSCSASASATITQPASALSVSVLSTTNIACFGASNGAITISATGGTTAYSYNWGSGITTQNRTGLADGTYRVTVTDANSCSASASATITQPASALVVAVSSATNVSCFGGNNGVINISATGGTTAYAYNWGGGITTEDRANLSSGNYNVTVTDASSCSASASAAITQPASALAVAVSSATNVSCFGGNNGSIYISATGGTTAYSYNWGGGITTQNRTGLASGNYSVTVTDANACSASALATLSQAAAIQLTVAKTDPLCVGTNTGNINTTVTGGVPPMNYLWNTGGTVEDPQGVPAGNYSVVVTDNNGCTTTGSALLGVVNPLTLIETHTNATCSALTDANIYTQVSGGLPPYYFIWNNGATSRNLMGVGSGSYSVAVTDNNGCIANINVITISEPSVIGVAVTATNIACEANTSGSIDISITGGTSPYQYQWNNNTASQDLTNIAPGNYSMTVTDANGCSNTASAFITTLPQLNVSATVDQLVCSNSVGGINLTVTNGTAPFTYLWNTGATTEDINNIHPGTYTVVVRDANNCPFDTAFTVTNQNNFSVNASGGGTITLGEFVDLHAASTGSAQTTYNWSPTAGMDCSTCTDITIQPGHSTLFTVVAIDTNGCEAKDTLSVTVIEDHVLFPPNAFSPNGDGNNDVFQLFGNLTGIKKFNIMIFDRWGEKVFEANEPTFTWDGIYKGEPLGPTVCVYVMKAVFLDGHNEKIYKGSITILR